MEKILFISAIAFLAAMALGTTIREPKSRQTAFLGALVVYLLVLALTPRPEMNFWTYLLFVYVGLFCIPFNLGLRAQRAGSWARSKLGSKDHKPPVQ